MLYKLVWASISLYIFKEPDAKVAKYAKDKKLNMLYAVDKQGRELEHVPDQVDADEFPDREGRQDHFHRRRLRSERIDRPEDRRQGGQDRGLEDG